MSEEKLICSDIQCPVEYETVQYNSKSVPNPGARRNVRLSVAALSPTAHKKQRVEPDELVSRAARGVAIAAAGVPCSPWIGCDSVDI